MGIKQVVVAEMAGIGFGLIAGSAATFFLGPEQYYIPTAIGIVILIASNIINGGGKHKWE